MRTYWKKIIFGSILWIAVMITGLGFSVSAAETATAVSIQLVDEETDKVFHTYSVKKLIAGESYTFKPEETVRVYADQETMQGQTYMYMYDFNHEGNQYTIASLSAEPEKNVLRLYYKRNRYED